jgi:hypothetical protein
VRVCVSACPAQNARTRTRSTHPAQAHTPVPRTRRGRYQCACRSRCSSSDTADSLSAWRPARPCWRARRTRAPSRTGRTAGAGRRDRSAAAEQHRAHATAPRVTRTARYSRSDLQRSLRAALQRTRASKDGRARTGANLSLVGTIYLLLLTLRVAS